MSEAAIREEVASILASAPFANASRSRRFLEYVVEQALAGRQDLIKEFTIAVEVFGRKDSYDSREHSAVRVEASRVRSRLRQYYEGPGREDRVVIDLPKGGYVPAFSIRQEAPAPAGPVEIPPARPHRRWIGIAAAALVAAVVAGVGLRANRSSTPEQFRYRNITESTEEEASPSISADGESMAYARRTGGKWHIFFRRIGGAALDLTANSEADNTEPALSPDGRHVAFRSTRDGGGIFLTDIKGAGLSRLSDFGFNPAWSPDGKQIVCASETVLRPEQRRGVQSSLWKIDVASRSPTQIYAGDAVQPSWSPSGKRIAFWRSRKENGTLAPDIWTMAADGSDLKPVTSDAPIDWCPRWSPDGRFLYFLSDRAGAMNLWRVAIDESSGKPRSVPEPQTTPSADMSVYSFARSRMAYESRIITGRIVAKDLRTGELRTLVTMAAGRQPVGPDLSRNGQWIAFYSIGKQEDIYVVRADGSGMRQITDDAFHDRGPRWSADGKTIAFVSNRSGRSEVWTVHPDGSGLTQFTHTEDAEPIQPVWSPDGRSLAYSRTDGNSVIVDLKTGASQTLPARGFLVRSWSPDGKKLVGQTAAADKTAARMLEFDLGSGQTRELGAGNAQSWAPDGKHILFERDGAIWWMDAERRSEEELASMQPNLVYGQRLSADGHLYMAVTTIESDLWMREAARE